MDTTESNSDGRIPGNSPTNAGQPAPAQLDPKLLAELDAYLEARANTPYTPQGLRLTSESDQTQPNPASKELQNLLNLLDQAPVENPPSDLVAKTLARIESQDALELTLAKTEGGFS